MSLFPWQDADWQRFLQFGERQPHALLIEGLAGIGKSQFALHVIANALCDKGSNCGQCRGCQLYVAGSHPDLHVISSEWVARADDALFGTYAKRYLDSAPAALNRKPKRQIAVDQIRALIDAFGFSQHSAGQRIALIAPAEAMNINAANALLKLLEEPPADSLMLLVCSDVSRLPATIRSRCVHFPMTAPDADTASRWLQSQSAYFALADNAKHALRIVGGAPLLAVAEGFADRSSRFSLILSGLQGLSLGNIDAIEVAEQLNKISANGDIGITLDELQCVYVRLIRARHDESFMASNDSDFSALNRAFSSVSEAVLHMLYDQICQLKSHDVTQLNPQLVLEKHLLGLEQQARAAKTH